MDAGILVRTESGSERLKNNLLTSCLSWNRVMNNSNRFFTILALTAILLLSAVSSVNAATSKTANFTVNASDRAFAQQVSAAAEQYREELAILWLGKKLPRWSRPCVITVTAGPDLDAGGETVFSFSNGEVYDWKMRVQGSNERILDSVLPHEVTHTIIASYLRAPAPRWLDEGMATAVEADIERSHYRTMLATFLHSKRGIAFNDMVSMKDYPKDLTPFYSQSFSICEYLISVGGYRRLAEFAKYGSETKDWNAALQMFYECDSLGALQTEWIGWVHEWDVANQPAVLPATRKLADFDQTETALAQNTNATINSGAAFASGPNPPRLLDNLKNLGRIDRTVPDSALVARAQNQEQVESKGKFQGLTAPFAAKNPASDIISAETQNFDNSQRAGSIAQNLNQENKEIVQTSPNGVVWRSGENLLSNGAGSASVSNGAAASTLKSPPVYYRPAQNSAYSEPSGLTRR